MRAPPKKKKKQKSSQFDVFSPVKCVNLEREKHDRQPLLSGEKTPLQQRATNFL
jgi:hypothetical protein